MFSYIFAYGKFEIRQTGRKKCSHTTDWCRLTVEQNCPLVTFLGPDTPIADKKSDPTRPDPPPHMYYVSRVQHSSCQHGTIYNCCMISRETVENIPLQGPSIKYVTLFLMIFDPHCHKLSQILDPPKSMSYFLDPPSESDNIICENNRWLWEICKTVL